MDPAERVDRVRDVLVGVRRGKREGEHLRSGPLGDGKRRLGGDYEVLAPSEMGENGAFYYLALRQRDLPSSELFVPSATGSDGWSGKSSRYALSVCTGRKWMLVAMFSSASSAA